MGGRGDETTRQLVVLRQVVIIVTVVGNQNLTGQVQNPCRDTVNEPNGIQMDVTILSLYFSYPSEKRC